METRNIILCADGTGNKGGFTADSNVFKTYNAVDIKPGSGHQITFYDNGVGTSANKFLKAVSGALGFGFQRNVRDLYTFLSQNYRPRDDEFDNDKVFMFGFSRGAATIRALNGLVHDCGLIDSSSYDSEEGLRAEVGRLIKIYLKARYSRDNGMLEKLASGAAVDGCPSPRRKIDIEYIGVWDTVAALGMPKHGDETGLVSRLVNWLFNRIDDVFNFFMHHRAYNFQLTGNIKRACHALSIDDARTSFWPRIWNEVKKEVEEVAVDQVWFAGMHSDVGGGYPRQDMSNVSLLWILEQAAARGLRLNKRALKEIEDRANVHDKMHDSRDRFGMFYRYHPRDIKHLCRDETEREVSCLGIGENRTGGKLVKAIRIHESVLSRMYHRTAGYAPVFLPPEFNLVDNDGNVKAEINVDNHPGWKPHRALMKKTIKSLKELYVYQVAVTVFVVGCAIYAWNSEVEYQERNGFWGELANVLQYFLPDMFNNAVELWVHQQPDRIVAVIGVVALWWIVRQLFHRSLRVNAIELRKIVIAARDHAGAGSESDPGSIDSAISKYKIACIADWFFIAAVAVVLGEFLFGIFGSGIPG